MRPFASGKDFSKQRTRCIERFRRMRLIVERACWPWRNAAASPTATGASCFLSWTASSEQRPRLVQPASGTGTEPMGRFIEIPGTYLAEIAEESDRIPRLYYDGNHLLRRMFWQRLYCLNRLMNRCLETHGSCLDFGGGAGVLLPTLANNFRKVFGVEKPWDHYHTGYEVEAQLERCGFTRIKTTCVPLHFPVAALFLITAWRRE